MKDTKKSEEIFDNVDATEEDVFGSPKAKGINAFIQKNTKIIIILSIAVIVLVGLILLFRSYSQQNEQNAALALSRIEDYYIRGEYQSALNGNDSIPLVRGNKVVGLLSIVSEYGSTSAGQRAALYAADSYYNLGKFSEAKQYYEKAIQSSIDEVKVGGLAGTAACDEKDGKVKDAAAGYLKAVDLIADDGLKLRYMYFAGLCKEKAGVKDESLKIYRDILLLNQYSEFNNLAKAGIVRLGEEIE
jgi:tetratricopeptide (TPR) repeat protein